MCVEKLSMGLREKVTCSSLIGIFCEQVRLIVTQPIHMILWRDDRFEDKPLSLERVDGCTAGISKDLITLLNDDGPSSTSISSASYDRSNGRQKDGDSTFMDRKMHRHHLNTIPQQFRRCIDATTVHPPNSVLLARSCGRFQPTCRGASSYCC